jgi:hypothetical protein
MNDLLRLNGLRADFMKWADSNEPSTWELDVNDIGGRLTGFTYDDDPTILLVCDKNGGHGWYLCVNKEIGGSEISCYPIESMTAEQIFEIRRLVESWLAKKDLEFF